MNSTLEHANITVSDPERTAAMLVDIFGWTIRWKGDSLMGGRTVHVGGPELSDGYLAVYTTDDSPTVQSPRTGLSGLNHIGVLVDDLDATEQRVLAAGYETHTHMTYDPGSRFYFDDHDGVEFEVVSYT